MKIKGKNNKKGISLIVLVITIIVMIILAAAVILSLSSNGIINRANEAVDKTNEVQVQSLASLAWSDAYLNGARTQSELTVEVYDILKEQGITKSDYILDVTENGVGVVPADTWEYAYTCTGGVWNNERIEKGSHITGEIVAKFYKTGEKVKAPDIIKQEIGVEEADEYRLVITGTGELGEMCDPENEIYNAWLWDELDCLMAFKITEIIISGEIEHVERIRFNTVLDVETNTLLYGGLETLIIEGASGNINMPNDLAGEEAIVFTTTLKNLTIIGGQINVGRLAFNHCMGLENVVILGGITEISNGMFFACSSLKNITLPEGLTSIGEIAFSGCGSLTNIIIPNSVTAIGHSAFQSCSSLANIIIPNGITSIDNGTFSNCSSLASITIPNSVTNIGQAFGGCDNLKTVYYTGTEDEWNQITIDSLNDDLINANIIFNYSENN